MFKRIIPTQHAIERWNQRGIEGMTIEQAVLASAKLDRSLVKKHVRGSVYSRLQDIVFVMESTDAKTARVITLFKESE